MPKCGNAERKQNTNEEESERKARMKKRTETCKNTQSHAHLQWYDENTLRGTLT
jgi:hypothetical protein